MTGKAGEGWVSVTVCWDKCCFELAAAPGGGASGGERWVMRPFQAHL